MSRHIRIMILDRNRYSSHLMERELIRYFPNSIVVLFDSADRALDELAHSRYDAAVIDLETCRAADGLLSSVADNPAVPGESSVIGRIRTLCRNLPLVLLLDATPDAGAQDGAEVPGDGDAALLHYLSRKGSFQEIIPGLIKRAMEHGTADMVGVVSPVSRQGELERAALERAAGRLAHEANNPLMSILGISELLLNDPRRQDDDLIRKIRIIRSSAQRIVEVLRRLSGGELSEPVESDPDSLSGTPVV